ncbi:hypothetical protein [Ferrimonas gelatinilytica]|uniref:Uncharacterized protein n=1 Tax=Ferrimonas gelatinilytica TaxID=1255257 RepID=A0ABP9S8N6_9GAMM
MVRSTLFSCLLLSLATFTAQAGDKTLYLHYSAEGPGGCTLTINRIDDGGTDEGSGCSEDNKSLCESDPKANACVCGKKDNKVKWKVSKESVIPDGVNFTVTFTAPKDARGQAFSPFKNENQCGATIIFGKEGQNCALGDFALFDSLAFEYEVIAANGIEPGQPDAIHCVADPRIVIEH